MPAFAGMTEGEVVPAQAGTQYAAVYREGTEYWMPAYAGMTTQSCSFIQSALCERQR